MFQKVPENLGIAFTHEEDAYLDFNRQKLIPYMVSDRGPAVAIGDLNGDGKEDIFFGSSKFKEAEILMQRDNGFAKASSPTSPPTEEVAAAIADFNQDRKNDLFIGTAGADFSGKSSKLLDQYFVKKDSAFVQQDLPEMFQNAAIIAPQDIDGDGDIDIFIGNQSVTGDFGTASDSYLLLNDKGTFSTTQSGTFKDLGMLTNAIWDDFTGDGVKDLIVVGEWMSPQFFENNNGQLKRIDSLEDLNGLWQAIAPFDIDGDGDTDYLLGNWGTNSKFEASASHPMIMYHGDIDKNGQTETIVSTYRKDAYYPLSNFDELSSQLVSLKKKYGSYAAFAGQSIEEIFDKNQISETTKLSVHTLESGYLKNDKGQFSFVPFGNDLQVAPVMAFAVYDFDNDGSQKSARHLNVFTTNGKNYLLVTYNNESAQVYALTNYK